MIFRKVSDLKREKELAEKRKNDPALNQSQDHLVRKLFSKFKKTNTSNDMSALVPINKDPEKGEGGRLSPVPVISRNNSSSTLVVNPKVPEVTENGGSNTLVATSNKPPSSSILNVNKSTNKVNSELTTMTETTERQQRSTPANGNPLIVKPKPMANGPRGWGRLKARTEPQSQQQAEQETLSKQEPLEKINDSATTTAAEAKTSRESDPSQQEPKEPVKPKFNIPKLSLSSDSDPIPSSNIQEPVSALSSSLLPQHSNQLPMPPPEYSQMIANLMEFKVNLLFGRGG